MNVGVLGRPGERLADVVAIARKRLKDETPTVSLSDLSTPKLDGTIADLQKQLDGTTVQNTTGIVLWRDFKIARRP